MSTAALQVDNDGAAVPITTPQDVQSSDEDEDMSGDDENGGMQCEDHPGAEGVPVRCSQDALMAGSSRQKAAPIIDDDGFQLVQKRRQR
jgi:hypothetical protein